MKTFRETFLNSKNDVIRKYSCENYYGQQRDHYDYNGKHNAISFSYAYAGKPVGPTISERFIHLDCFVSEEITRKERNIIYNAFKTEELKIDPTSFVKHSWNPSNTIIFKAYCGKIKKPFYFVMYKNRAKLIKGLPDEIKLLIEIGEL